MKKTTPWILSLVLILTSLACSITVNIPTPEFIDPQTWATSYSAADAQNIEKLSVKMGSGTLNIQGGSDQFLDAAVTYNVAEWKPEVLTTQRELILSQGNIDDFKFPTDDAVNDWDLTLGSQPVALTVNAGAYTGDLDLTGVALTQLTINDGASQAEVHFDTLNPIDMDELTYKTGASEVKLIGLGNANVDLVTFEGGAGSYTLDFTGAQTKDMRVKISVGVSNTRIIIPENMAAVVTITGGLNNIDPSGTWSIHDSTYTKSGKGSEIEISVEMGLGNLELIAEKSSR